ncbi:MAG: M48 family metallopeptidase [Gammaproteobacteria bacterium]|nr:M48 family metallopeptidase [Gammaproteobacteria bacterium]
MASSVKILALPDYDVRISTRSQRVYIKMNPLGKIEVVVPKGFDQLRVPDILHQRQEWISKARHQLEIRWAQSPEKHSLMPEQIDLRAVDEIWQVQYQPNSGQRFRLKELAGHCLHLTYPEQDDRQAEIVISQRLQQWVTLKAKKILLPWLAQVSHETGMSYKQAQIRAQKTRWGSCSSRKIINLNRNLMFLSPELVRYLFIHELSHTRYMNHSVNFWKQVEAFEVDYRKQDRKLGLASKSLPLWVHI